MELTQIPKELRKLVVDDIDRAIKRLIEVLDVNSRFYNDALQLKGRLSDHQRNKRRGILSREEIDLDLNRLRFAFLDLVNAWEKQDIRSDVLLESDHPFLEHPLSI